MEELMAETEGTQESLAEPDSETAEARVREEPVPAADVESAEAAEEVIPPGPTFYQRLATSLGRASEWIGDRTTGIRQRLATSLGRASEWIGDRTTRIRQRLVTSLGPAKEWTAGRTTTVWRWLAGGNWIYGLIAVLVIVALILPPISLLQRLGLAGYVRLNANNPSTSHPDGITISALIEGASDLHGALAGAAGSVGGTLRVRLNSVPQVDFLEGAAGGALKEAVEALPPFLQVKSPFYEIDTTSRGTGPGFIEVAIPNNAEPWETLDLYTWTGQAWQWIGGTLDLERELLVAFVSRLPSSVVVMQTLPVVPAIGTIAAAPPQGQVAEVLTDVLLPGLYLGTDGALLGQAPPAGSGGLGLIPLVRNWQEDEPVSLVLLADVLSDPDIQQAHVEAILAAAAGYAGLALDYRGVASEQREAFSAFVAALAEALHEQDLRLEVAVPAPTLSAAGWETGAYDWAALGAAADALLIPFPDDPAAYAEGGEVASLLSWAVGQVDRYRLRALVSSLSADQGPEGVHHVGLDEALAPFGQVHTDARTPLEPGGEASFTLAGQVTSIVREETAGTYSIAYQTEDDTAHTVWPGISSFLARKLDWALRYHLRGVVVADLAAEGNFPGIVDAVEGYRAAASLAEPAELEVTWQVQGPGASTSEEVVFLSQPDFRWTVPSEAGQYTVSAAIAGVSRGSVQVTVVEPAPTPLPNVGLSDEEAACLHASFVDDVTVPDGTHFNNGESFVKTWRLSNSGSCDWPENTLLAFADGTQMGGPDSVPVGAVASGETVDISVDLTAPDSSDRFQGSWALKTGDTVIPGGDVYVLIVAGDVVAASPAPAPVSGGSFELGGHVRDMNFPYGNQMHYAGMNWAKVQVRYRGDPAGLIAAAHANGFKIQLSALGPPELVTQPGFEEDVASWVAGMAAAGADAIEVWNEPNIDREWQSGYIDPAAYTRLLCAAYSAIKAANPGTLVISAAPAPTGYFGGCSPLGCDDQPWMEGMYNAGAANCMDFIGAHHNSGATSPSARSGHPGGPHHSWYFLPQTELYYNTFRGTRKLYYTEMGYASQQGVPTFSDQFAWARENDNSEQAAWLAEAVGLSVNTGMVRCIIVWNIDFGRFGYDPQDGYAIIRPGGACPACDALHAVLGTR